MRLEAYHVGASVKVKVGSSWLHGKVTEAFDPFLGYLVVQTEALDDPTLIDDEARILRL